MSKELEAKDLQANFIKCFNELLTKTDKDIIVVNISREMAQDMVNLYEKYSTINPSEALECWNWLNATIPQWCREKDKDNQDTLIPIKQYILKSQEQEKVLEILKPLCEVVETPVKKYRYLKINGVVVYSFKNEEEFDLLKRYCNEQDNK